MSSNTREASRTAAVLLALLLVSTGNAFAFGHDSATPVVASGPSDWSLRAGADVSEALGVPGARVVDFVRPAAKAPSDELRVASVPVEGGSADFTLEAFDVFTPDAHIVAMRDGAEIPLPRPTSHLYRGRSTDGRGDMFMAVDGASCQAVVTYGGETSFVLPMDGGAHHVLAKAAAMPRPSPAPTEYCGADFLAENQKFAETWDETKVATAGKTANAGLLQADIMLDVANGLYANVFASNTTTATNYVNNLVGAVSAIYERDINVRLRISSFTVWTTADPFSGSSSSAQLNSYVTWARANRTAVQRDYGHLLLNGNATNYGGVAYLDVLCDSQYGYGLSNIYGHANFPTPSYYWDMDCVSHEMGHNFGSPHTHCYSPPIDMCYNQESGCYSGPVIASTGTIMSYCHLTSGGKVLVFSQREIDVIRGGATSATCLSAVTDVPWETAGVYSGTTGSFFLRNQQAGGGADVIANFGPANAGWIPLSGDWDGNGTDTIGLYAPSTGVFWLKNSNAPGGADIVFQFGPAGGTVKPLVGDWNGDGVDTVGLYNTGTATFFLRNSNTPGGADLTFTFGAAGATIVPIVGDWNGDRIDTVGIYNSATGTFFLRNYHSGGGADLVFSFGAANGGYTPIVGDWNGDSVATVGLYSPTTGTFFLKNTSAAGSADLIYAFGPANLTPIVGNWDAL